MLRLARFRLIFAPETANHLAAIERKHYRLIRSVIHEQLSVTPEQVTRNRKTLEHPAPFGATWELRFGPRNRFRVFYEVDRNERVVWVLAIGVKEENRLYVGGKEFGR